MSDIIFASARPDNHRDATVKWLGEHCPNINYFTLIMRNEGDRRPDTMVKEGIYKKYFKGHKVKIVFDDRPCVIDMWSKNGLSVIDVGSGIDF